MSLVLPDEEKEMGFLDVFPGEPVCGLRENIWPEKSDSVIIPRFGCQQMFAETLNMPGRVLCALGFIFLHSQNNHMRWVLLLFPFYSGGD